MSLGTTGRVPTTRLAPHVRSIGAPSLGWITPLSLGRVAWVLPRPPRSGAVGLRWVALVGRVAWALWVASRIAVAVWRDPLPRALRTMTGLVHVGWGAHLWLTRVALGASGGLASH
jgi:hypothetical protein